MFPRDFCLFVGLCFVCWFVWLYVLSLHTYYISRLMLGYEANLEIVILILVLLRKKTIRKVNSQMKQLHILTVLYKQDCLHIISGVIFLPII